MRHAAFRARFWRGRVFIPYPSKSRFYCVTKSTAKEYRSYYEVVIRVETFYGAHNPPYGLETMTFYVGPLDAVRLVNFDHQDEPD